MLFRLSCFTHDDTFFSSTSLIHVRYLIFHRTQSSLDLDANDSEILVCFQSLGDIVEWIFFTHLRHVSFTVYIFIATLLLFKKESFYFPHQQLTEKIESISLCYLLCFIKGHEDWKIGKLIHTHAWSTFYAIF